MSLLEMLRLALQLVAVIAPIVSQIGKDGNEQVIPGKLPEEAKVILDTLATKAPSAQ